MQSNPQFSCKALSAIAHDKRLRLCVALKEVETDLAKLYATAWGHYGTKLAKEQARLRLVGARNDLRRKLCLRSE